MYLLSTKICSNCIFHREGPTPFSGTCANREWQPPEGVIRLVRDRELACYREWGVDSFQPRGPQSGPDGGPRQGGPSGPGGGSGGVNGRYVSHAGGRVLSPELVDKLLNLSPGRGSEQAERGKDQLPLWAEDVN